MAMMTLEEALAVYVALNADVDKAAWNRQLHLRALNVIEEHAERVMLRERLTTGVECAVSTQQLTVSLLDVVVK